MEGANPDGAAAEASQSQVEDVDPIKKDLELKNKEIIDLKVRPTRKEIHRFICSRKPDQFHSCRIGISAQ